MNDAYYNQGRDMLDMLGDLQVMQLGDDLKNKTNKMEKNSNHFKPMYDKLGINIDKLGCIMLDIDGSKILKFIDEHNLYYTKNKERFWINGFVAGKVPHVTLLYGLMESGATAFRKYVDEVLAGWTIKNVVVDHVGHFDSPYEDEPYYCIVAHLKIDSVLLEGHNRLQFLPHINTFPEYKAHITIAYIKKDDELRQRVINMYNGNLANAELKVLGINYGK